MEKKTRDKPKQKEMSKKKKEQIEDDESWKAVYGNETEYTSYDEYDHMLD